MVFQNSAAGMVVVGIDMRFIEVNEAFCRMTGYSAQELKQKTFSDITHPDDQVVGEELTRQLLSGARDSFHLEKRYLCRDGTVIWGLVSASVLRNADGIPLHFVTQVQDVTSQRNISYALARSEERYRRLFQEMSDACVLCQIVYDDDGRPVDYVTLDTNKAVHIMTEAKENRPPGVKASATLPPGELKEWLDIFAPVAANGGTVSYQKYSPFYNRYFEGNVFSYEAGFFIATFSDVTVRKTAEQEVARQTRLNQLLLDGFPCIAVLIKMNTQEIVASNQAAKELGGTPGAHCYEMWSPRADGCVECVLPGMIEKPAACSRTSEALGKVWDKHWVPIDNELCMCYAFDITEQIEAKKALLHAEERFRFVLEEARVGLWDWDLPSDQTYYSSTLSRILGEDDAITQCHDSWKKRLHPDDRDGVLQSISEHLEERSTEWVHDFRLYKSDGTWLWVLGRGRVVSRDADGRALRMVGIMLDISSRKLAEESLKARERDLRNLSQRLIRVREEERNRIARNIHDDLGHAVMNIKMNLFQAELILSAGQSPLREFLKEMKGQVDDLLESIQRISMEIRPAVLYDLGLAEALHYYIRRFEEQTHISCRVLALPDIPGLPEETGIAVYRIIQEVFVNMFRHSGCTEITLELRRGKGQAELRVADNGKGIAPESIGSIDSLGIIGMKERAISLGGSLDIRGVKGRGTVVILIFPLPAGGGG